MTYVCVGISVSGHTAVHRLLNKQSAVCHVVCLLGRCVNDGYLTSGWLWAELVNVVDIPPTDSSAGGLVQHRVKPEHWHQ